ncbi:hypothetical protein [Anaeromyxobacter oryzae]|uniref:Uncharacterized protein n=1 Tax=Anaeromyxobacter oryzae TaxID=2918170 RepID=A0ABN6MWQ0_9BACT|nr:hypothetical protein [Anaeromyxobacter oryzae]BDG05382.1 hypothetical protein AMOR_43780 [Anaeromyxobacter oryzae]
MSEERHHRTTDAAGPASLPRRLRTWLGLAAEPPLRRPRAVRLEPIRRTWLAAFWHGRVSVAAGVPLDDYLRSRLARYLSTLPIPRARLPLAIDVQDGELIVHPLEPDRRAAAALASDPDAWLAPLVAVEGPTVRQEVQELEVKLSVLEGEAEAARRRGEELSRRLAADVAAGLVTAPSGVEATAEQLGRPPIRSAWPQLSLHAFIAAAFAAETWQVALPILHTAEVDPARLGAEASRRPIETIFAALFALGVSAALFALAHVGLEAGLQATRAGGDRLRRRSLAVSAVAAAAMAALVATALGGIQAPARMAHHTYVLLLLAVPLATALVLRRARAEGAGRAAEEAAALEWDRERARTLAERARRLEELDWADEEERDLERQRDSFRRRLREISARAMTAARLAEETERRERAALSRLAQSLVGALELDRYEFVRLASARGATQLLAPRRRKPGVAEVAAPTPPSVAVQVGTPAEAGRLAS